MKIQQFFVGINRNASVLAISENLVFIYFLLAGNVECKMFFGKGCQI